MAEGTAGSVPSSTITGSGTLRFLLLAGLVTTVLFGLYWAFVRTVYIPVLTDLTGPNSADIAKVLDEKAIAYRFEDNGGTIAVVSDQADRARVELAGSELSARGQVGFELFNQSDMGLTEFAQKINYQRALQGELARTILQFEGIQSVRVHLGLPERGLFRSEQSQPKAAVTLILKPGKALADAEVTGIQRLIAGAVPDMVPEAVAVLDGSGRIVSPELAVVQTPDSASDAVIQSVRQRLALAIARENPGLRFGANVSLRYDEPASEDEQVVLPKSASPPAAAQQAPRGVPNYSYAIRITTVEPITEETRSGIQSLIAKKLDWNPARGDSLVFLVGPIVNEAPAAGVGAGVPAASGTRVVSRAAPPPAKPGWWLQVNWWTVALVAAVFLLAGGLWLGLRRAKTQRLLALTDFSDVLSRRLELEGGS